VSRFVDLCPFVIFRFAFVLSVFFFKAPSLPLSLRLKVSGCHYNISCNIKISQEKFEDTKEAI
jgi:hypothetical protein